MKCPHCKYVSFDFLDVCKKCGKDLVEIKAKRNMVTFQPAVIPTLDDLFNVFYPRAENAVPREEPLIDSEEEAALSSDVEPEMELTIERTDLTLEDHDILELEEEAGRPAISMEEEGLRFGDEVMDDSISMEEDLGETLSFSEKPGTEQKEFLDHDIQEAETVSADIPMDNDIMLDTGLTLEGLEPEDEKDMTSNIIGGEPEFELDMETFEIPTASDEEYTPTPETTFPEDLESTEEPTFQPDEQTSGTEPTVKLTSSPLEGMRGRKGEDELNTIEYELDITDEDLLELDDNKK